MIYSLINVVSETASHVIGSLVQDFTGDYQEAQQFAKETEQANSNRIKIAVCDGVNSGNIGSSFTVKKATK